MSNLLDQPDMVWDIIKSVSGILGTLLTISFSIIIWVIKKYVNSKDDNDKKILSSIAKLYTKVSVVEAHTMDIESKYDSMSDKFDDFEKRVVEKLDKLMIGHAAIEHAQKGLQSKIYSQESEIRDLKERVSKLEYLMLDKNR